ncbi:MAG TPA: hypothetical protein VK116_10845, partial [Planctomycetota bacterium]|nr:hypothetical protein [Planctomycetota bacterium]
MPLSESLARSWITPSAIADNWPRVPSAFETLAILGSFEIHSALSVMSLSLPSENRPIATKFIVWPRAIVTDVDPGFVPDALFGRTAI